MLLNWAIPEKKSKHGVLRIYFFEKTLKIFRFVTLPLELPDKMKFHPWQFHQTVLHPRPIEIPRYFLLDHAWKFHFLFTNPLSFCILFLQFSRKFHVLNPFPCLFFSWSSPLEVAAVSQTEIYKLLIPQTTRFGQRAQTILLKLSFWICVSPDSLAIMNLQTIL